MHYATIWANLAAPWCDPPHLWDWPLAQDASLVTCPACIDAAGIEAAASPAVSLPGEAEKFRKQRDWWKDAAMELAGEVGSKDRLILNVLAIPAASLAMEYDPLWAEGFNAARDEFRAATSPAASLPGEQPGGEER